jgi:hypothetical protein
VFDVAADIGAGLAKAALAGVVDGREVDTSHVIERDTTLSILTDRDEAAIEIIRHSTAHLLAQAVQQLFPEPRSPSGRRSRTVFITTLPRATTSRLKTLRASKSVWRRSPPMTSPSSVL